MLDRNVKNLESAIDYVFFIFIFKRVFDFKNVFIYI
jgi:hypothetical protein